ncbi:MAG: NAD(P)/FAD-dependent oxidoreductase [Chloroflexi bacterium]|nr:NAD(P)/FAD-dependent oxidoreductase [Chloroflexota bacterium]
MSADAIVIGAGPNGLGAAIALARAGHSVVVHEAEDTIGGGCRSAELTLPGFVNDICSAIHPLAAASPFFRELPLERYGLEWIQPAAPLAHPLDDGTAVVLERDVDEMARSLGRDGGAWRLVFGGTARDWERIVGHMTGPLLRVPRHPLTMARAGAFGVLSARALAELFFRTPRARSLIAGLAAHSFLSLDAPLSATFALALGGSAHAVGWPLPRGGSQRIADALVAYLRSLGGEVRAGDRVAALRELDPARAYLFDVTPAQLDTIAGDRLPDPYRRSLRRFRPGPGVFKLDYALSAPVPWRAAECARAGTVHLGGTFDEIAAGEAAVMRGEHPERPFVLVAQQSLFDPTRAPAGKHTLWAYCHVPNGSRVDMIARIEAQLERFAPGFRDVVLARHAMDSAEVERRNAAHAGGDISGGAHTGLQLIARPTLARVPHATPARDIYLCSASTPPGGGVHGMCGYLAAQAALARSFA